MPTIELAPAASPVVYVLYAFMTLNMVLSALILLYTGVRKFRPAKAK